VERARYLQHSFRKDRLGYLISEPSFEIVTLKRCSAYALQTENGGFSGSGEAIGTTKEAFHM